MEMEGSAPSRTEGRSRETCPLLVHLPMFSEGHPQEEVHPAEKSWSPRQEQEQSSFSATAALTVLQGVSGIRSWRMAEWLCFGTDVQGSPCCIEGNNVSHCTHKYLWLSYIFSPNTHIIFWLLLLLIDLPLSTGCQEMPQTVQLIILHSAPILHRSAFPSSMPDIFGYPAAETLAQKGIPVWPLSSGPVTQCNSPVKGRHLSPNQPCHLNLNKHKQWVLVDLPLAVFQWRCPLVQTPSRDLPRQWVCWEICLRQKRYLSGDDVDPSLETIDWTGSRSQWKRKHAAETSTPKT